MKLLFSLMAVSILLLAGCQRSRLAFNPKPEEMLTQKEKFALMDYVRGFVLSSSQLSRKLSPSEKEFIQKNDPKIRIHYKAPKAGRLNLTWEFRDGRTLSALCEGELLTIRNPTDWQINLTSGQRIGAEDPAKYGIGD